MSKRAFGGPAVVPVPFPFKGALRIAGALQSCRSTWQVAPVVALPNQEKIATKTIATTRSQNRFFFHVGLSAIR